MSGGSRVGRAPGEMAAALRRRPAAEHVMAFDGDFASKRRLLWRGGGAGGGDEGRWRQRFTRATLALRSVCVNASRHGQQPFTRSVGFGIEAR